MNSASARIKKLLELWRKGGFGGVRRRISHRVGEFFARRRETKQIEESGRLTDEDRREIRRRAEEFPLKPLVSIILPIYNVEEKFLRACLESVTRQLYPRWELCVADDASPGGHVRRVLEEYAARDPRVRVVFRETNGHISAASNSALRLATGEFAALLDHDDELAEDALFYVVEEINRFPETELIYSDEDKITEDGARRFSVARKPRWSPDLLYSLNLVTHLAVFRLETLRRIGGFRAGFEGAQDYDLVLRFYEAVGDDKIRHVPRILYHWRAIGGSVALGAEQKSYAHERARLAIREHLERKGKRGVRVVEAVENLHRVIYELPPESPKVSLILNAAGDEKSAARTIENVFARTDYANFQIAVGVRKLSAGLRRAVGKFEGEGRLRLVSLKNDRAGFVAGLNEIAGSAAEGEILVFLEGNLLPRDADWLRELAGFARQKETGAAGAKMLFFDETVRSAGLVPDEDRLLRFAHRDLPRDTLGDFFRASVVGNYPAVSGACLATRREVFTQLGGFDAANFPRGLHDADLCLRLGEKKYRVVFTPYAELVQFSASATEKLLRRKNSPEAAFFRQRWKHVFEQMDD